MGTGWPVLYGVGVGCGCRGVGRPVAEEEAEVLGVVAAVFGAGG
jgi:hypothetical protein